MKKIYVIGLDHIGLYIDLDKKNLDFSEVDI